MGNDNGVSHPSRRPYGPPQGETAKVPLDIHLSITHKDTSANQTAAASRANREGIGQCKKPPGKPAQNDRRECRKYRKFPPRVAGNDAYRHAMRRLGVINEKPSAEIAEIHRRTARRRLPPGRDSYPANAFFTAADALAKSWKLQDEWGATPLGKTGRLSHPSSPFDATGKRWKRRGR